MSSEGRTIANNFLTMLCRGILTYTRSKYRKNKELNDDGFENMYERERLLILDIFKIIPSFHFKWAMEF